MSKEYGAIFENLFTNLLTECFKIIASGTNELFGRNLYITDQTPTHCKVTSTDTLKLFRLVLVLNNEALKLALDWGMLVRRKRPRRDHLSTLF